MVNVDNLNMLISTIKGAKAAQCIMSDYEEAISHKCGTAHCVGGWIDTLIGTKPCASRTRAEWLGITTDHLSCIELMIGNQGPFGLCNFDAMLPSQRKKAMLNLLELLKTNKDAIWDDVLEWNETKKCLQVK